jgi:serine/tyrosine/threonine adenylyltransferase
MINTLQPARDILEIADFVGDPVDGADFPQTILRFRNDRAAHSVGLDGLSDAEWVQHFGRFQPIAASLNEPLALRYHGHQFRNYNPDIGDGRGFLFAQLRDESGKLLDLGTKGSGQTPYSRFGDGRLTLKGAVREILATEMLEALGVTTSKTFSVIETGEALHRGDEPSPTRSAVMFRLSHGHIRIGSFQRLATLSEDANLKRLTDYALLKYYGEEGGTDAPVRLLRGVVARTADLAASYMVAGFVHGVLNSDNINISGESFDYGPWRFTPRYDQGFTAAYFDEQGLYAFGRQAEAIHWDVVQLAIALSRIVDQDALIEEINQFATLYRAALVRRTLWRLRVNARDPESDEQLADAIMAALSAHDVEIDQFYFDWAGGTKRTQRDVYSSPEFLTLESRLKEYSPSDDLSHPFWQRAAPTSLHIEEVEEIWAMIAEQEDWSGLDRKVSEIRAFGEALSV